MHVLRKVGKLDVRVSIFRVLLGGGGSFFLGGGRGVFTFTIYRVLPGGRSFIYCNSSNFQGSLFLA